MSESRDRAVLDAAEWVRYFGILCRDDGLDDIYNAEEKLKAHDEAMRRRIADLEDERDAAVGVARAHRIRTEAAEAALAEMTNQYAEVEAAWLNDKQRIRELRAGLDRIAGDPIKGTDAAIRMRAMARAVLGHETEGR